MQEQETTQEAPKRVVRLSRTEHRLLKYLSDNEGKPCPKSRIGKHLGRCEKTVDRLIAHLRNEGYIRVTPMWGEGGAQLGNSYVVVPDEERTSAKP